ncbi:MAG TPA: hypothetical protein VF756_07990 [Thermoanaerobaculia bacterium]
MTDEAHEIDLDTPPEAALAAVGRAAEAWGAKFDREGPGGTLYLPVVSGLRRGLVSGPVTVEEDGEGSRVVFRPEETIQYVQTAPVVILVISGLGGIATVLWPFFPELLPISSLGAVLALGGWFLVLSRLRTSGPQEFLVAVAAEAEGDGLPG